VDYKYQEQELHRTVRELGSKEAEDLRKIRAAEES
jgi:hypothetical protein